MRIIRRLTRCDAENLLCKYGSRDKAEEKWTNKHSGYLVENGRTYFAEVELNESEFMNLVFNGNPNIKQLSGLEGEMKKQGFKKRFFISLIITTPILILSPTIQNLLKFSFSFVGANYIIAILSLIFLHAHSVLNFFLGFLLVFLILSIIAFSFAKEKRFWLLLFLPLYRIYYQALWYFVLYKALFAALKGVFVPWAKLIHYGTVTLGKVNSPAVEAV